MENSKEPVLLAHNIKDIEIQANFQKNNSSLMEKAGLEIAIHARELSTDKKKGTILILIGPGNNGVDALIAAFHLKSWWFHVTVFLPLGRKPEDLVLTRQLNKWVQAGGKVIGDIESNTEINLVIDGIFGIGLNKIITGKLSSIIKQINKLECNILSIDTPSGIDSDTGTVMGVAIKATHTLTFIGHKPGLYMNSGADHAGIITVRKLGTNNMDLGLGHGYLISDHYIKSAIKKRDINSHKGMFGKVLIIGGAEGMYGATILTGRAAIKLGAGKVQIGILDKNMAVDFSQPDIMIDRAENLTKTITKDDTIIIGPGLGKTKEALACLERSIKSTAKLVVDADALNLIAENKNLDKSLGLRKIPTVFTPHPAEAGRLIDESTAVIQRNRISAAKRISKKFNVTCVLKGCGTIICDSNGMWHLNITGNPGMSTSGMGDVLAGIIGALIAQNSSVLNAALAGCRLHGLAADALVSKGKGPIGLTASETIDETRKILNKILKEKN